MKADGCSSSASVTSKALRKLSPREDWYKNGKWKWKWKNRPRKENLRTSHIDLGSAGPNYRAGLLKRM